MNTQNAPWLLQAFRPAVTFHAHSSAWGKVVLGHWFFFLKYSLENFYWKKFFVHPPCWKDEEKKRQNKTTKRDKKNRSCDFIFISAGRGCEQCRQKQTPVEKMYRVAAILDLHVTMRTSRFSWHGVLNWAQQSGRAPVSTPTSWWNRLGRWCGLRLSKLNAVGLTSCKSFLLTEIWQRSSWLTALTWQALMRTENASSLSVPIEVLRTAGGMAGIVLFGHLVAPQTKLDVLECSPECFYGTMSHMRSLWGAF